MSPTVIEIELLPDLAGFKLPRGVQRRLQYLLDQQDQGKELSVEERQEAEGLIDIAEWMSLLKLRSRPTPKRSVDHA